MSPSERGRSHRETRHAPWVKPAIAVSGVVTLLTLATIIDRFANPPTLPTPTGTHRPAGDSPLPTPVFERKPQAAETQQAAIERIKEAAKALGIQENPQELAAWERARFRPPERQVVNPNNPDLLANEVLNRFAILKTLMRNSSIPAVANAGAVFSNLQRPRSLVEVFGKGGMRYSDGLPIVVHMQTEPKGSMLLHTVTFGVEELVLNPTKDMQTYIKALTGFASVIERADPPGRRLTNDEAIVYYDAGAAEVIIGLIGIGDGTRTQAEIERAQQFIAAGRNPESQQWKDYIQRELRKALPIQA